MSKEKKKRSLGLDYGLARIGVALSDETKIIASPLKVVYTEKKLERTAAKIVEEIQQLQLQYECEIDEIVLGIPLQMNGKIGMIGDEVKQLAEILKSMVSCSIILWDERLSSVQADRALREGNMTRKRRSKEVDKVTSAIILQSYLDYKKGQI